MPGVVTNGTVSELQHGGTDVECVKDYLILPDFRCLWNVELTLGVF